MGNFKKLRVWNDSVELATRIYGLTSKPPFNKDFGLSNQLQRASVSVASNIAEGDERGYNQDSIRFFHMAKGSAAEVITQLYIAQKIGYLENDEAKCEIDFAEKIRASLKNLIKIRNTNE